jgi:hypothetical protein
LAEHLIEFGGTGAIDLAGHFQNDDAAKMQLL